MFSDVYSADVYHSPNKFYLVVQNQPYRHFTRLIIAEEALNKQQFSDISMTYGFDLSLEDVVDDGELNDDSSIPEEDIKDLEEQI